VDRSFDDGVAEVLRTVAHGPRRTADAVADHLIDTTEPPEGRLEDVALLVLRRTTVGG
jgi:hypothetical protein